MVRRDNCFGIRLSIVRVKWNPENESPTTAVAVSRVVSSPIFRRHFVNRGLTVVPVADAISLFFKNRFAQMGLRRYETVARFIQKEIKMPGNG